VQDAHKQICVSVSLTVHSGGVHVAPEHLAALERPAAAVASVAVEATQLLSVLSLPQANVRDSRSATFGNLTSIQVCLYYVRSPLSYHPFIPFFLYYGLIVCCIEWRIHAIRSAGKLHVPVFVRRTVVPPLALIVCACIAGSFARSQQSMHCAASCVQGGHRRHRKPQVQVQSTEMHFTRCSVMWAQLVAIKASHLQPTAACPGSHTLPAEPAGSGLGVPRHAQSTRAAAQEPVPEGPAIYRLRSSIYADRVAVSVCAGSYGSASICGISWTPQWVALPTADGVEPPPRGYQGSSVHLPGRSEAAGVRSRFATTGAAFIPSVTRLASAQAAPEHAGPDACSPKVLNKTAPLSHPQDEPPSSPPALCDTCGHQFGMCKSHKAVPRRHRATIFSIHEATIKVSGWQHEAEAPQWSASKISPHAHPSLSASGSIPTAVTIHLEVGLFHAPNPCFDRSP
jgi:hypothetical protein